MSIKRLPMRESVIRRTTILSAQLNAVNLSQGFPDDDTFPEMKRFAVEAIAGSYHQYTDPWGSPVLRRAIAQKLLTFNNIQADPDRNIVVTCGATEGMIVAMEALIERGDEVITFAPMYENYVLQSIASGVRLKTLEVSEPDFAFTRDQLEALWTPATAAILLCNPCNPTGKVFRREELETILEFATDHDLLILCDETYEYRFASWRRGAHDHGDVDGQDVLGYRLACRLPGRRGIAHRRTSQDARFPHCHGASSVPDRAGERA
jgi:aspartate/methionine/tyrosine aminotransferase